MDESEFADATRRPWSAWRYVPKVVAMLLTKSGGFGSPKEPVSLFNGERLKWSQPLVGAAQETSSDPSPESLFGQQRRDLACDTRFDADWNKLRNEAEAPYRPDPIPP